MDSGGGGGGVTAIRVPYRHLCDAEMELVSLNSNNATNSPRARASGVPPLHKNRPPRQQQEEEEQNGATERTKRSTAKYRLVLACMVAAGVQFGWALQLSLLTPYIQIPIQPSRRRKEDKLYKELEEMKEEIVGKCLPLLPSIARRHSVGAIER